MKWTTEEDNILRQYIPTKGPAWCWKYLNALGYMRTESSVNNRRHTLQLRYQGPPLGRIRPGDTAPNKGKKLNPQVYEAAKATMFKKGNRPQNAGPVGTVVIRSDGYRYIKVAEPRRWEMVHRLMWIQHHGEIPEGMIVVFKDGNPNNITLGNLEAITRAELVRRNRWGSGPSQYSLITGRAATSRLKKMGIKKTVIRENPELINLANAETLLKQQLKKRNR